MLKVIKLSALCVVLSSLLAPAAFAAEGGEDDAAARRRAARMQRQIERQQRLAAAKRARQQGPGLPLGLSKKAREELERHHKALRALMAQIGEVHKAVARDMEAGMEPKAAAEKHIEAAKAIAKKMVAERAAHLGTMSKIVTTEGDDLVDRWAEQLLERLAQPAAKKRRPRKPDPENIDEMNPFEE